MAAGRRGLCRRRECPYGLQMARPLARAASPRSRTPRPRRTMWRAGPRPWRPFSRRATNAAPRGRSPSVLQVPRSTVAAILARAGLNLLTRLTPPPVQRYERAAPGDLVHLDIKPLARILRVRHRIDGDRRRVVEGAGYEYAHVAIDDHSRVVRRGLAGSTRADHCGVPAAHHSLVCATGPPHRPRADRQRRRLSLAPISWGGEPGACRLPELREIRDDLQQRGALVIGDRAVGLSLLLVGPLGRRHRTEGLIPVRFEGRGDQAMIGIDPQTTPPCEFGLVLRAFDLLAP